MAPSQLQWYTVNEAGPWEYEGPIEMFRKDWPYSRIYSSWDKIDKRFNQANMIWRPARSELPTKATDLSILKAIHRAALQENPELFDSVPEEPIEG